MNPELEALTHYDACVAVILCSVQIDRHADSVTLSNRFITDNVRNTGTRFTSAVQCNPVSINIDIVRCSVVRINDLSRLLFTARQEFEFHGKRIARNNRSSVKSVFRHRLIISGNMIDDFPFQIKNER